MQVLLILMEKIILSENSYLLCGECPIIPNIEELINIKPNEREYIYIYNKHVKMPRFTQSFGHAYNFSGMNHTVLPVPQILQPYLDWANSLIFENKKYNFNMIYMNWYENGNHYIGKHKDDIKNHVPNSPIISISIGCERLFRIRNKNNEIIKEIMMKNNSFIIMCGNMQKEFYHEVPKDKSTDMRINITIRAILKD